MRQFEELTFCRVGNIVFAFKEQLNLTSLCLPCIPAIPASYFWGTLSCSPRVYRDRRIYNMRSMTIRFRGMLDRRVEAVIEYMLEDLSRPLRLQEVAHSVNLSASRLQHLFKANTNMTPAQYLKSLRMQKAKQLIDSTFLNTKEVMRRVGMKDESHFVREFKKIYGLPPGSYKQRLPTLRITTANSANK